MTVITGYGTDGPAGATANAFSSLSLEPQLALVCFDLTSRTLHAVRESERFAVNMLAAGQEDVSRLFATKLGQAEKFAAIDHRLEHGAPVIDGCLAWLVCALDSELRRGDHVIAIGRVLGGALDEHAEPLVFHQGRYRSLPAEEHVAAGG